MITNEKLDKILIDYSYDYYLCMRKKMNGIILKIIKNKKLKAFLIYCFCFKIMNPKLKIKRNKNIQDLLMKMNKYKFLNLINQNFKNKI